MRTYDNLIVAIVAKSHPKALTSPIIVFMKTNFQNFFKSTVIKSLKNDTISSKTSFKNF